LLIYSVEEIYILLFKFAFEILFLEEIRQLKKLVDESRIIQIYELLTEMIQISLLSDTHGYLDNRFLHHLEQSDEIWHAGDIGDIRLAERLAEIKPLRAVHGNIDGQPVRKIYPAEQRFLLEGMDVWIVHIGGYPGHYDQSIKKRLIENPPDIFITGHSHILRIQYDKNLQLMHINPGAAGKYGLHKVQTIVKFVLDEKKITNLEVVEFNRDNSGYATGANKEAE